MLNLISKPLSRKTAYFIALIFGIIAVDIYYSKSFLLGNSGFFEDSDPFVHFTSWYFYAVDQWRFPLLWTNRLNHPEGINVAFTDVIPLAAMFFKPLTHLFPQGFHYFGIWHGLVLLFQAVAATFFARTLGLKNLPGLLAVLFFSLTWPTLHNRVAHAALMTHGILLLALAFYWRGANGSWSSKVANRSFLVLSCIGLLIHPYFLPFTAGIWFAFLLDQWRRGHSLALQLSRLAAFFVLVAVIGWVFGYFGQKTTAAGFHLFSMNLDAPFCGDGALIPCAFHDDWGESFEAYNYLGAGLLLLLPFAMWRNAPDLLGFFKNHPVLVFLLVGFFLYAITNKIHFGSHSLLSYPLPAWLDPITGTFRMSGRFFWPLGYLLLFGCLLALLRTPTRWTLGLVMLAIAIQWIDGAPQRNFVAKGVAKPVLNNMRSWAPIVEGRKKVFLYPTYGCGPNGPEFMQYFQQVAGHHKLLINTADAARRVPTCQMDLKSMGDTAQPDGLYALAPALMSDVFYHRIPNLFVDAAKTGTCFSVSQAVICAPGLSKEQLNQAKAGGMHPTPFVFPITPRVTWTGVNLAQFGGRLGSQGLRPKIGADGFEASVGPFVRLPKGSYRVQIRYSSGSVIEKAGQWALASGLQFEGGPPSRVLALGDFAVTENAEKAISVLVTIDEAHANQLLDLRISSATPDQLHLISFYVEELSTPL